MPNFIGAKNLIPFISNELVEGLQPIKYLSKDGRIKDGFKAKLLPMVCDVYLCGASEPDDAHVNASTDSAYEWLF